MFIIRIEVIGTYYINEADGLSFGKYRTQGAKRFPLESSALRYARDLGYSEKAIKIERM